ncbi:hypothetical protein HHI36_020109 [Cryptolaemus montrouzieri]|uniref:Uncharacterized protein n=1 Tax=Cryptolaemus montrouzieri TaxID=559131 RepID=A0ABD2N9M6_9CUCU
MLDEDLRMKEHILYATDKAKKTINNPSRILQNATGPSYKKRKAYKAVVESIVLRVSCFSACVIAELILIELLVEERALAHKEPEGKKKLRKNTLQDIETLWNSETDGAWTKKLIKPNTSDTRENTEK